MTDTITIEAAEARAEYRSNAGIVLDGRDADLEALAAALLFDADAEAFVPENRGTHASEAANAWRAFHADAALMSGSPVFSAMPCECPALAESYTCAHGALVDALDAEPSHEIASLMGDVYVHHRISFKDGWKRDEPRLAPVRRMWIDVDGYGRAFISATKGQRPLSGNPNTARWHNWGVRKIEEASSIEDRAAAIAKIWKALGR